ncbi:MAG: sigma-54-dependent Fis family transcriptional regulator [Planctomycetota bacterium]|nr:MAG: sigma-54-dependent Fis family transcriptional regulator [Planctomycetota bacterium]
MNAYPNETPENSPSHWLVIDDEESICWGFRRLGKQVGAKVTTVASAEDGLAAAAAEQPDVVVLDVRLPGMSGLDALEVFRRDFPHTPVIVITAYGDLETAVEAVRRGAVEYLTKPFDIKQARRLIEQVIRSPSAESTDTRGKADDEYVIVGNSPAMQEVFKKIALAAAGTACVHLKGETGTGKELVARAIHRFSRRADGPFVPVNIASLSPTLAESELFGHERGAFTGAESRRRGLLQQADGGTLFIDEVAEIPEAIQVKLLRSLDYGEVLAVGAERPVRCDFRIISATHQDLAELVRQGTFRRDLYFRLVTFEIELPPLRERRDDIPLLAEHFLARFAARNGRPVPTLAPETLEEMERRPWWGNVRELRNCLESAAMVARGGRILPEHLPPPFPQSLLPERGAAGEGDLESRIAELLAQWTRRQLAAGEETTNLYQRLLDLIEPPVMKTVFDAFDRRYAAAARVLGLHRTTLRKRLARDENETNDA